MDTDIYQWGRRIKTIRQSAGLSQAELAEKMGVSLTTMNRIEVGKSIPDVAMITNLSNLFSVSPLMLISGEEEGSDQEGGDGLSMVTALPVFTEPQILSGKTTQADSTLWIRFPGLPGDCFLYKTFEQAMAPTIQPGDFVAVVADKNFSAGSIVLLTNNYGIILIRKLGKMCNGDEYYLAENSAYPPIKKTGEERILGRVVAVIRMLLFS